MATHFKGPVLGSVEAGGGYLRDLPIGVVSEIGSQYHVWFEDFEEELAAGELILGGAHVDELNTPTAPDQIITSETGCLIINAGTKADAGSSVVFDIAPTAARLGNSFNTPRALTSTATLMDARCLVWAARVGFISNHATTWDGKTMLGWLTADSTPMVDATGVPSLATGGGLGFHIGENGVMTYFGQQTAVTATPSTTVGHTVRSAGAGVARWYELAVRCRWIDASSGTGVADFYVNGAWVGRRTTDLPMASTQVYASTLAIQNGPTQLSDLAVDWMFTAISRPGITITD
jgi:hypothetical protein